MRSSLLAVAMLAAMSSCHADVRTNACDPYRTPHLASHEVSKPEVRSAHAPYITGDCSVCHPRGTPVPGESEEQARLHVQVIRPVNEHCVSCHGELFRRPPRGHPPEQAFCTSCHDPHASKQRSLLLDDDLSRACLDYAPPYPPAKPRKTAAHGSP